MSVRYWGSILFNLAIYPLRDVFAPIVQNYAFLRRNEEDRGGSRKRHRKGNTVRSVPVARDLGSRNRRGTKRPDLLWRNLCAPSRCSISITFKEHKAMPFVDIEVNS